MRAGRARALALLTALALAWGLCWRLEPQAEPPAVEAVPLREGQSALLAKGQAARGGVAFRNCGRAGCRLRVRLCVPQVDGKPVLEAGHSTGGGFVPAGTGEPTGGEYWTAQGEYLYYHNEKTGGLLLPGRETPAVYTAVRLNEDLAPSDLEKLLPLGWEQQLFVLAEPQPE